MSNKSIDLVEYRRALSCFATGVAVATTLDESGRRAGMTISSFSSVSLDPPLVLWSIANDSVSYDVFMNAEYFAINVLAISQNAISARFAQSGKNKFEGLGCLSGIGGVPILPECSASFECAAEHRYEGGDHKIIVGRVLSFEDRETDPLIFYRGQFLQNAGP